MHFRIDPNLTQDVPLRFSIGDIYQSSASGTVVPLNSSSTASVLAVGATVGVEELDANTRTSVYPNPTAGDLTILSTATLEKVEVCNFAGQVVLSQLITGKQAYRNASELSNGIYLVNIYSEHRVIKREKIVIQH